MQAGAAYAGAGTRPVHGVNLNLKQGAVLIALAFSSGAFAQTPPSVGQVLQSVPELRSVPPRPDADALQFAAPEAPVEVPAPRADEARLRVNGFTLSGNTVFSESDLLPLLQQGAGRELSLGGIEALAARISAYYHEHGYLLARAYVPAQTIKDGRVEIRVAEGRLGEISISRASMRLRQDRVDAVLAILKPGAPIHVPTVERALLLLTDMPGLSVSSRLRPGREPGTADLIVALKEGPAAAATLSLDNHGTRHTGRNRLSLGFDLNDPLGLGDRLTVQGVRSNGDLTSGRVAYEFPLGGSGLRAHVAYGQLDYGLGGAFTPLGIEGGSKIYSAGLQYPLVRTRDLNVSAFGGLERKHVEDDITALGLESHKVVTSVNAGLSATLRDNMLGGGVNLLSGMITGGRLSHRTPADAAADLAGPHAGGDFVKFNWQAGRVQRLSPSWSLAAMFSGQTASRNLDSSEKFFLGGPASVRAYPVGEAAGDQGMLGTAELRYDLARPSGMQLIAFADAGRVRFNTDPYAPGGNYRSLAGVGLGVNWDIKGVGDFRASYARKVHRDDSDSASDERGQFWMSLSVPPEALLALPLAAPTAFESGGNSRVQIYGMADAGMEVVRRESATPAGPRGATQSATPSGTNVGSIRRMRSNSSALGFRGRERLARGLTAWYQFEMGVTMTDGSTTGFRRNTGVGVTSRNWGTLMSGFWDTPYKYATASLDPFSGKYFNSFYNIIGNPGFSVGTASEAGPTASPSELDRSDASFARRQGNSVQYWSPKFGPVSLRLMYSATPDPIAPSSGDPSIFSGVVKYDFGALELTAAYELHKNYYGVSGLGRNNRGIGSSAGPASATSSRDEGMKLGLRYDFGATRVGFILERLRYREDGVIPALTVPDLQSYERDAAWIGISHRIGKFRLKGAYGIADKGKCAVIVDDPALRECTTEGLGAEMLSLGVEYNFSRRTAVYANYGQVSNRPSANYNFVPGGVFGAGVGSDTRGFGIGIKHSF